MNAAFAYRETFESPTHDFSMWQTRYDHSNGGLFSWSSAPKTQSLRSHRSRRSRKSQSAFGSRRSIVVETHCAECPPVLMTKKVDPFDPYPELTAVEKSRRLAENGPMPEVAPAPSSNPKVVPERDKHKSPLVKRDSIKSIINDVRSELLKASTTSNKSGNVVDGATNSKNDFEANKDSSGSDEVFKKIENRTTRYAKRRSSRSLGSPSISQSHPLDCSCSRCYCSANARSNEASFSARPSSNHHESRHHHSTTITRRPSNGLRTSSGYDGRDRGGRGRDMYRDSRHRSGGGGGSDRENETSLSDRDQRSERGSFNRSMSNADGMPDDKIGKWMILFIEREEYIMQDVLVATVVRVHHRTPKNWKFHLVFTIP